MILKLDRRYFLCNWFAIKELSGNDVIGQSTYGALKIKVMMIGAMKDGDRF